MQKAQHRGLGPVTMLRAAGLALHVSCIEMGHIVGAAWVTILVGPFSLPEIIRLSCRKHDVKAENGVTNEIAASRNDNCYRRRLPFCV